MAASFVLLVLAVSMVAGEPDVVGTRPGVVSLPQSFLEADGGFVLLGDGLTGSFGAAGISWQLSADDGIGGPGLRGRVDVEPVGARPGVAPVGEALRPGVVSRFQGTPEQWRVGQRTFGALRYAELWEGIDLHFELQGRTLKGTYVVAPGADPGRVRLRHRGADAVTLDDAGRLVLHTAAGALVDAAPVAWHELGEQRHDVPVAYRLEPRSDGAVDVGFQLGAHDPTLELLIDPAVIVQAGFLGGVEDDTISDLALGDDGSIYLCGWTQSDETSFPVVAGPELVWDGAGSPTQGDAFVAKLDPSGTTLLYCGFLGGSEFDFAQGLAVDDLGRATVAGHTGSTAAQGFPEFNGPPTSAGHGGIDGWVARLTASGTGFDFCGFVGGNSEDRVFDVDVDAQYRTYMVGRFKSLGSTLPLTVGPYLTKPGGSTDCFIARLAPDGQSYQYCGFLGGSGLEDITEVAADSSGAATFAGWTGSADFPIVGALGTTHSGASDTVVGRVRPDGTGLLWSGFLGGALSDIPNSVAVDSSGATYVAGSAGDTALFPAVVGPLLTPAGLFDGYLSCIAPDGQSLLWSGFAGTGYSAALIVDEDDGVWALTSLTNGGHGDYEALLARVAGNGAGFDSYDVFGPPGVGLGLAQRRPAALTPGAVEFWVAGNTSADEQVIPVAGGPDLTANGGKDAVLMRVRLTPPDPWSDQGCALAGVAGEPLLVGSGPLTAASSNAVELSNAAPSATCAVFIALQSVPIPFKQGVLKAHPFLPPVFLTTSAAGGLSIPFVMPAGVPAGSELWVQFAIQEFVPFPVVALSNAVLGVTP